MNTEEYWEDVALKREIAVQEGATATAVDILRLYDEALDDIENEVQKIKANFQRRFGIDEETADYFLTKAQEEENLKMLTQALEVAPDEQSRKDILAYINRDGLSVRAYSARIERYQAVKESIYARIKMIAVKGIPMLENMMTKAYKESYYGNIEDTARGLDIGIDFALLDDEAIRQAVNVPWKGSRFSKRLWGNTERLAKVAQDLTVKAMMNGESLTKTANKLADAMQSSKFHATTLIRTEVSHAHNMADLKAYEDMNAKKYKYLATLDYRTCTTCQPLDNTSHNVEDAKEGVNCPVMHPRCRCTTTIDMEYTKRRARDPVTGRNELVDGGVTYEEWVNNMSPEQKQALETARKKDDNKTADKLQHAKYKKALGTKEVPRGFKEFQEMKYTNPQRYNELKSMYRQANSVDKSAGSGIMKAEALSIRFVNSSEGLFKNSQQIRPIEGFEDIVIHGDKTGFAYHDKNGNEMHYTVREFADILKSNNVYNGGNIRLISCETGADGATAAQSLANQLNVTVMAPSNTIWVMPDGTMTIGSTPSINDGEWRIFKPKVK